MKTYRRDKLLRLAKAGRLVCIDSYHFDDMTGQDRSDYPEGKPVYVLRGREDWTKYNLEGFFCVHESDFKGHGRASTNEDKPENIWVRVHSNCNYTVRVVDTPKFPEGYVVPDPNGEQKEGVA